VQPHRQRVHLASASSVGGGQLRELNIGVRRSRIAETMGQPA
jgi:hypothetical protein